MIATEEEIKLREKQSYIDKYYVETGYCYSAEESDDFEYIGKCKPIDLEHDGENFVGSNDMYAFNVYDSFEEALNHHHKRIDCVELIEEGLTEEQKNRFYEFIKEKMADVNYLKEYGLTPEQIKTEGKLHE